MQVDVAVVVDAGLPLDLEQRGLAHAGKIVEFVEDAAAQRCLVAFGVLSGLAEASVMIGVGLRLGRHQRRCRGRRRAEQRCEQAALLGWRRAQPAEAPSPSHRPDSRAPVPRSPAHRAIARRSAALPLQETLRRRSALARQRPPLALPEALNLVSVAAAAACVRGGRSRRCPASAPARRRPLREAVCRAVAWHRQIVGGFAGRGKIGGGGRTRHSRRATGLPKSNVGSVVAEHAATKTETIATERMRHSAVALRDRCLGNPVPLPVSEPARR